MASGRVRRCWADGPNRLTECPAKGLPWPQDRQLGLGRPYGSSKRLQGLLEARERFERAVVICKLLKKSARSCAQRLYSLVAKLPQRKPANVAQCSSRQLVACRGESVDAIAWEVPIECAWRSCGRDAARRVSDGASPVSTQQSNRIARSAITHAFSATGH